MCSAVGHQQGCVLVMARPSDGEQLICSMATRPPLIGFMELSSTSLLLCVEPACSQLHSLFSLLVPYQLIPVFR